MTPHQIQKNSKVIYDGTAMLVWPRGVFYRIRSTAINFAVHYEGIDMKTNFNIYDLDTVTAKFRVIKEGYIDQTETTLFSVPLCHTSGCCGYLGVTIAGRPFRDVFVSATKCFSDESSDSNCSQKAAKISVFCSCVVPLVTNIRDTLWGKVCYRWYAIEMEEARDSAPF